jgi:hypothetical protein
MYGTISDFRAYATLRGNSLPASSSDALATAALVRGSDYIRTRYVLRFVDGYDDTLEEVEEATYIAAARELLKPGFWSKSYSPGEAKALVQVDSLRWQVLDKASVGLIGADTMTPVDGMIEALLGRYISTGLYAHFVI